MERRKRVAAEPFDPRADITGLRQPARALLTQVIGLDPHHLGRIIGPSRRPHRRKRVPRVLLGLVQHAQSKCRTLLNDPPPEILTAPAAAVISPLISSAIDLSPT